MTTHSLVTRTLGLLGLVLAAACGDNGGTETPLESTDMAGPVVIPAERSTIGDACVSGKAPRGSCSGDDTVCLTAGTYGLPGGMCSQDCTALGCPSDAACVRTDVGDLCLALCNTNTDCRGPDYVCSAYKVCEPALGFYAGFSVRPGTNAGEACAPAPADASSYAPGLQVSEVNGAQVALAVDDAAGNIVIAWQDMYEQTGIMFASSQDGGATFSRPALLPARFGTSRNAQQTDPVAAVDSTGTFFIAWTGVGSDPPQIYIASSSDAGQAFAVTAAVAPAGESALDVLSKPSIAIAPDDSIYLAWTTTLTDVREVRITRSVYHGVTWSAPITVNPADGIYRDNARVAVAADGTVYVAWVEADGDVLGDAANDVAVRRLLPDLTLDGPRVVVTGASEAVPLDVPAIAVDGAKVYVAYTSGGPDGAWDIKVAGSLDGATTFAPAVKVNSDATCATHFHPSAAVDGSGKLHVVYFDNRELDGALRDSVATSTLTAAALTFSAEDTINDTPFPFSTEAGYVDWLGDYVGLAISGSHVYVAYPDSRTNYTAQVFFTTSGL